MLAQLCGCFCILSQGALQTQSVSSINELCFLQSFLFLKKLPLFCSLLSCTHCCSSAPTSTKLWALHRVIVLRAFAWTWRARLRLPYVFIFDGVEELAAKLLRNSVICSFVSKIGSGDLRLFVDFDWNMYSVKGAIKTEE